jgi:anti-sigma factor RsiW
MNDAFRSELERYFDGELSSDRQTKVERVLSEDSEARLYVNRLSRLRTLARSHEPAFCRSTVRGFVPPPSRARFQRVWAVATVSLVASVAAMFIVRRQTGFEPPRAPNNEAIVAPAPMATATERPVKIQEVEVYTWANRDRRSPDSVVNTVLLSRTRSGKLPAAMEILALDLANAPPSMAEELEPLAMLHKSAPGGHIRSERRARRPRSGAPGM